MQVELESILNRYGKLLSSVDEWFGHCRSVSGKSIACGKGCSRCCRGLFDITLLDALYLRHGFNKLPDAVRRTAIVKAEARRDLMLAAWPDLEQPYILNVRADEDWDDLMPDDDETPCPLLGDDGLCMVYEYRPMTCRLHGIPLIDVSGEAFHDEWCTMNFRDEDPLVDENLRWGFRQCFKEELYLFRELTGLLLNLEMNELDTFIPTALLVDLEGFDWCSWWGRNLERIRIAGAQENL